MSEKHYYEQIKHTKNYLIPYFRKHIRDFETKSLLEVGCAEGGFLQVLAEMGMDVTGVELSPSRVETARQKSPELDVRVGDITSPDIVRELGRTFDLIVFRDVIEHIPDRDTTFRHVSELLNPGGYLFFSFPPRYSGFAGHQQVGRSILRFVPFLHLLPNFLIRWLGKLFNEYPHVIDNAILNYQIGLTIRRFERFYRKYGFEPVVKELFLIRPIYEIRFKLKPLHFPNIPFLREIFASGCEVLLRKD